MTIIIGIFCGWFAIGFLVSMAFGGFCKAGRGPDGE